MQTALKNQSAFKKLSFLLLKLIQYPEIPLTYLKLDRSGYCRTMTNGRSERLMHFSCCTWINVSPVSFHGERRQWAGLITVKRSYKVNHFIRRGLYWPFCYLIPNPIRWFNLPLYDDIAVYVNYKMRYSGF